jgi:hypothetical protein
MKVKICPECGSDNIGDRWCKGRKLQYYCHEEDCNWEAEPRTPSKRKITDTQEVGIDDFSGWSYIVYDKFGHVSCLSATHNTEAAAMKDMEHYLKCGEKPTNEGGPYTGVIFNVPHHVTIKGKMFKMKNGVVTQVTPEE